MSGLLNYTTEIAVEKTVGEIYSMLARAKASAILTEMDGSSQVTAISFKMRTVHGEIAFRLPVNIAGAAAVLNKQAYNREIPKRLYNNLPQARRVAWRILRAWLEAQLALVQVGMAKMEEVFLPYAQNERGQTVYEALAEKKFSGLCLPAPVKEAA